MTNDEMLEQGDLILASENAKRRHEATWWFFMTAVAITTVIVIGLVVRQGLLSSVEMERMRLENEREHPPLWRKG